MNRQLLLLATFLTAASVQASTVIDNFDDVKGATNGMTLTTLNTVGIGGVGFLSKYEQTGSGVPVLRTNDLIVSLANYVSGQITYTQHWCVAAVTASSGAARRTQTRLTPTLNLPVWFSYLGSLLTSNGDVALTFNGTWNGSGVPNNGSGGLRVGLGNISVASCRGAMGIGPLTTASASGDLSTITNGVNGVITAAGFAPVNGTAGLVLGCIDFDPATSFPRVRVWYNPDVPNAASLPAPTLTFVDTSSAIVPTSITRVGEQVNRSPAPATQNEAIDNVKVSDEPNAFDIVYLNAPLPVPIINIADPAVLGSDVGPTNLVFTVTASRPPTATITIPYIYGGVATNGYIPFSSPPIYYYADYSDPNFDPNSMTSSITLAAGQTTTNITLYVTDNGVPKAIESAIITLAPAGDSSYLLGVGSATGFIVPSNTANVSIQYMFVNNLTPQVWDTNFMATPANGAGVGASSSTAYNNTGYGAYDYPAPNSCMSAPSTTVATNDEASALASGSYVSFTIAPVVGRQMTLTNLQFMSLYGNYLNQNPGATGAVVFVRSSQDGFATTLGSFAMVPAETLFPNGGWYTNVLSLGSKFANVPGLLEFRLYIYDDAKTTSQVAVRLGNLFVSGLTAPLPPGVNQVAVIATSNSATLGGTNGQFTISRIGDTSNPLAVSYVMGGTASNGVDYVTLPGVATIPAGQTNVVVTLTALPAGPSALVPLPSLTATLTLIGGTNYGVLSPSADTVTIAARGGLATWYFNESDNNAPSLSAAALPTLTSSSVLALNAAAGFGLRTFGANTGGGVAAGYATSQWRSAPTTVYMNGVYWGTNENQSIGLGSYFSFFLGAAPGNAVTLTNFTGWVEMNPTTGQTNWAVLRSSLDNFASDLGTMVIPASSAANAFLQWSVPLNVTSWPGGIEFRVYVWGTRLSGADIFRLDDVTLLGSASAATTVTTVSVIGTTNAVEPSTPGAFTLMRTGDVSKAMTVSYGLGGPARNGVDYATLSGSASFAAGASTLVIPVVGIPNADAAPSVAVTLTVLSGANYFAGLPPSGVVNIATVTGIFINNIHDDGSTVTINFSGAAGDAASAFHLQSSAAVGGTYADDNTAAITGSNGSFQAVTSVNGAARFYRIRR